MKKAMGRYLKFVLLIAVLCLALAVSVFAEKETVVTDDDVYSEELGGTDNLVVENFVTRMVLGNALDMQFGVPRAAVTDWTGTYAVVTKERANGAPVTLTIPYEQWGIVGEYYSITYTGVSAKEMNDKVTIRLFDSKGNAISVVYTDTVKDYVLRVYADTTDEVEKTMYIDMLNYGAAAQKSFSYNLDDLVDTDLTEEQKALATQTVTTENKLVKGTNYTGSRLLLQSRIELQIGFKNIDKTCHAEYTYISHSSGEVKTVEVAGEDFITIGSIVGVAITEPVVADCRNVVTVTVYNTNGEIVGYAQDSVESYVNRSGNELYETIMKFADSAYVSLHKEKDITKVSIVDSYGRPGVVWSHQDSSGNTDFCKIDLQMPDYYYTQRADLNGDLTEEINSPLPYQLVMFVDGKLWYDDTYIGAGDENPRDGDCSDYGTTEWDEDKGKWVLTEGYESKLDSLTGKGVETFVYVDDVHRQIVVSVVNTYIDEVEGTNEESETFTLDRYNDLKMSEFGTHKDGDMVLYRIGDGNEYRELDDELLADVVSVNGTSRDIYRVNYEVGYNKEVTAVEPAEPKLLMLTKTSTNIWTNDLSVATAGDSEGNTYSYAHNLNSTISTTVRPFDYNHVNRKWQVYFDFFGYIMYWEEPQYDYEYAAAEESIFILRYKETITDGKLLEEHLEQQFQVYHVYEALVDGELTDVLVTNPSNYTEVLGMGKYEGFQEVIGLELDEKPLYLMSVDHMAVDLIREEIITEVEEISGNLLMCTYCGHDVVMPLAEDAEIIVVYTERMEYHSYKSYMDAETFNENWSKRNNILRAYTDYHASGEQELVARLYLLLDD